MKKSFAILLVIVAVLVLLSLESIIDHVLELEHGQVYVIAGLVVSWIALITYLKRRGK
jgi:hypothetical protein